MEFFCNHTSSFSGIFVTFFLHQAPLILHPALQCMCISLSKYACIGQCAWTHRRKYISIKASYRVGFPAVGRLRVQGFGSMCVV